MSGGGIAPNGNTSNLPLFGTPEQQMADPLGLFPGTPPPQGGPNSLLNMGINPMNPKGGFNTGIHSQGSGPYNMMAAQGAGRLFNPSLNQNPGHMQAIAAPVMPTQVNHGAKGAPGLSSLPGGGRGKAIAPLIGAGFGL